jgi:pilus assembly protein Flp/PilA
VNDLIRRVFVAYTGRKAEAQERGATAVEYGMLVALIAAVIIATVVILGGQIREAFETITGALDDNTGA